MSDHTCPAHIRRALKDWKRSVASSTEAARPSYVQLNGNVVTTNARADCQARLSEVRELLSSAPQQHADGVSAPQQPPPAQTEPVPYVIAHTSYTAEKLWKDARQGYLTVCVWSDTQQQWVSAISCLDNLRAQLQYITVTFNGVEMVITHEEAPSLTVTELCARVEARFALVLEHARRPDIVNDGDKDGIDDHSATWSFVLCDSVARKVYGNNVINTCSACAQSHNWWTHVIDTCTHDFAVRSTYNVVALSTLDDETIAQMNVLGNRQTYADAQTKRAQLARDRQLREEQNAAYAALLEADRKRARTTTTETAAVPSVAVVESPPPDVPDAPDAPLLTAAELRAKRLQHFAPHLST